MNPPIVDEKDVLLCIACRGLAQIADKQSEQGQPIDAHEMAKIAIHALRVIHQRLGMPTPEDIIQ